ncbi:MAG TPA: DinB family protein [Vicinamibacteria bacterium]|jgi:uncharacterized damage-inducible protein DinB
MMEEIERIRKQLERTYSGDAWHGPSLRRVLEDVDADKANFRPIAGAHSIAELAAHVLTWRNEVLRRLEGQGGDVPVDGDWPAPLPWDELLERLDRSQDRLVKAVAALSDAVLDEKVKGRRESHYVLLQGMIHHDLYHAGQIALLKKGLSGHRP